MLLTLGDLVSQDVFQWQATTKAIYLSVLRARKDAFIAPLITLVQRVDKGISRFKVLPIAITILVN